MKICFKFGPWVSSTLGNVANVRHSNRSRGIDVIVATFLLFAFVISTTTPVLAQNDSWWPLLVINQTADCITDPSVNTDWTEPPLLVPPDTVGESCDRYMIDLLERPMIQNPDVLADYFPSADIDTVWFGIDTDWLYVGIGMRGLKDTTTIDNKVMFEVDADLDGRGDYLVVHEGGKYDPSDNTEQDFANGTFVHPKSNQKLAVWFDTRRQYWRHQGRLR